MPALVAAIDEAERSRGFGPPLWVDIRISRSVRAAGFRDHELEKLLGDRYVWCRDLGNLRITERTDGIAIKRPEAANDLLDLALDDPSRRVIFFCACERPIDCHRRRVANLVGAAARRRGREVRVEEWPGGEPALLDLDVPQPALRRLRRSGKGELSLPPSMSRGEAVALPWGSSATLRALSEVATFVLGPARFGSGGCHLRVLSRGGAAAEARRLRRERGYE